MRCHIYIKDSPRRTVHGRDERSYDVQNSFYAFNMH